MTHRHTHKDRHTHRHTHKDRHTHKPLHTYRKSKEEEGEPEGGKKGGRERKRAHEKEKGDKYQWVTFVRGVYFAHLQEILKNSVLPSIYLKNFIGN